MIEKFNVSVEMVERVSNKTNNTYNVCLITITCPNCNVGLVVEDFKTSVPFSVKDLLCTIEKIDNRFVITDLNYTIPWQYALGVGLLLNHVC